MRYIAAILLCMAFAAEGTAAPVVAERLTGDDPTSELSAARNRAARDAEFNAEFTAVPVSSVSLDDLDIDPTLQSEPFNGHLTEAARTVGPGVVSFHPYPGDTLATHTFWGNTLSVGIGSRFELGTMPVLFFGPLSGIHAWSVTAKANMLATKRFDLGLGITHMEIKMPSSVVAEAQVSYISLMSNYRFSRTYQLGANISSIYVHHATFDSLQETHNLWGPLNWFLDLSIRASEHWYVAPGISKMISIKQDAAGTQTVLYSWGAGFTVTWRRPGHFFASPAVGIHHGFEDQSNQFKFSTDFG